MNCPDCRYMSKDGRNMCYRHGSVMNSPGKHHCSEFDEMNIEQMTEYDNKSTIRCGDVADEIRKDVENIAPIKPCLSHEKIFDLLDREKRELNDLVRELQDGINEKQKRLDEVSVRLFELAIIRDTFIEETK